MRWGDVQRSADEVSGNNISRFDAKHVIMFHYAHSKANKVQDDNLSRRESDEENTEDIRKNMKQAVSSVDCPLPTHATNATCIQHQNLIAGLIKAYFCPGIVF